MKTKILPLALILAGALTGTANAAVIDTDDVKLTATGYDFGGDGFAFGEPTSSGEIHFHYESGTIRAHLLGTLHLNDADGTCSRMRMEYFDRAGVLLDTKFGGTVCVTDDQHHEWSVDQDQYSNPRVDSVRVTVMKQTATGWFATDSGTYIANTFGDDVKITEDGVDFGDTSWGIGAPSGDGFLTWNLVDGVSTPRLTGGIHLNNSSGVCARMNLRYLTEGGVFLTERAGGVVCASDNGHHVWSVDLDPWSSNKIGQVRVQLQTQGSNGSWNTAGSQVVTIDE